jgi:lipoprotein NlpI
MTRQTLLVLIILALTAAVAPVRAQDTATESLLQRAAQADQRRDFPRAIELLSEVIAKNPRAVEAFYRRGRANFCAGKIAESVADFDKYVALAPDAESRQWERGISYYYAGEYAKGARQFELYQTYHDQDVENSVWRYLCVARTEGVEKARANMLPIDDDRRIPMMQIYDLYRGKKKPEDVLAAAEAGQPIAAEANTRLFYAHLYLGLWHEAAGRADEAQRHIFAAEKHKIGHYMWDVAHVHAQRLRAEKPLR